MEFNRDLIQRSNEFAREDPRKSWMYYLSTLALWALAVGCTILIPIVWIKVFFSITTGLIMCRLFVIYHDYQHRAILGHSKWVDFLMRVKGWYLLAPSSIWNESHDHHHNHNAKFSVSVLGSFPIMTKQEYLGASSQVRLKYKIIRHPLVILLSYVVVFLVSFCLYPFVESCRRYWDCGISFAMHILLGVILFKSGGWGLLLTVQTIPFVILCTVGGYIFYAQHNFKGVILKPEKDWSYLQAALKSSSYIHMNPVWAWITANIGYHHIHHINSRIPFYRLPEAMANLPELQNPTRTSLAFSDIRSSLMLKLWDEELGEMVGYPVVSELKASVV